MVWVPQGSFYTGVYFVWYVYTKYMITFVTANKGLIISSFLEVCRVTDQSNHEFGDFE